MNLAEITPLILTCNEAPNIRDTLSRLRWATRVVVINSFSTDATSQIFSEFPNVDVFQRRFDHFSDQCNYGLTKVESPWVLSLDADYKCPEALAHELKVLDGSAAGYRARFKYCIFGKPLRATLYPPRVVLYRKSAARYIRDGHAHKVTITGKTDILNSVLLHDDRKSLNHWIAAQSSYAKLEVQKLLETPRSQLGWKERIRRWYVLAPVLTLFYCLFVKLLILDGWRGIYYSLQRVFAELILSLNLIDKKLRSNSKVDSEN